MAEHVAVGAGAPTGLPTIEHPSFQETPRQPERLVGLYQARLTDGHRVGVLLQIACLAAHAQLRQASLRGMEHESPLHGCSVDRRGRLRCVELAPRDDRPLQLALQRAARALFGAQAEIAGRGAARRSLRRLMLLWSDPLTAQPADLQVRRILRAAPFLWEEGFATHREAMVALHRREDGPSFPWVVGGAAFRERVLATTDEPNLLRFLVTSEDAQQLWRGRTPETPSKVGWGAADFAADGRWSAALARWKETPPQFSEEERLRATCLYQLGRFEDALEVTRGRSGTAWSLRRLECLTQLGQVEAGLREARRVESRRLSPEQHVRFLRVAIRLQANRKDADGVRRLRERARAASNARASVCAAEASWDLAELDEARADLREAVRLDAEISDDWRYLQTLGLVLLESDALQSARAAFDGALTMGRRRMAVFEAGRVWNDVVLGRAYAGDLAGAERAARHCARLLNRCQGPSRTTLALTNLAEIRIRRGRFEGVEDILARTAATNELVANRRGNLADRCIAGRFALARGRLDEAEQGLRSVLDDLARERTGGIDPREPALLLARTLGWLGRSTAARRALQEGLGAEGEFELVDLPRGVLEDEELVALWVQMGGSLPRSPAPDGLRPWIRRWRCWTEGERFDLEHWRGIVDRLGSFRASRIVLDVTLAGYRVEEEVLAMATDDLNRGAAPLADLLSGLRGESWGAVTDYLCADEPAGEQPIRNLFAAAGAPGVRVERRSAGGDEEILVRGPGGPEVEQVDSGAERWSFAFPEPHEALRAMARLVVLRVPAAEPASMSQRAGDLPAGVVGRSPALLEAYGRLRRLGETEMPVLIGGETGTGKEQAAAAVHAHSARADGPFLPVNCAAVDENLALSELFGHRKGAFTGADRDHRGVFESAAQGTVFLDEIGDLSARAQGLLLRVLQEKEIRRLGESEARPVDVRVVAATHRDLERAVEDGSFREDLLYRLNAGTVTLPPLRKRGEDIVELARHFLAEVNGELGLTEEAEERLRTFHWPGNVRQLRSVIERAAALCDEPMLSADDLDLGRGESRLPGWHEWLNEIKRERLVGELEQHGWNQAATARSLGLTRQALSYQVRQLGLRDRRRGKRLE